MADSFWLSDAAPTLRSNPLGGPADVEIVGGPAALVVVWLATAASVLVSMPWSPAFAACGAAAALVAVTVALRRSRG